MTTQNLIEGSLVAFKRTNRTKDAPAFQGTVTLPNQDERGFALWASRSKQTGEIIFSGRAAENKQVQIEKLIDPAKQFGDREIELMQKDGAKGLTIKPHDMVMFTNRQKDAEHPTRPDFWGYYNPGGDQPLMRMSAWTHTDRSGNVMLSGSIQPNQPEKNQSYEADIDHQAMPHVPPPEYEDERERSM